MANATANASWNGSLKANMLGYIALSDAWNGVSPPACAAGHYEGLRAGYAVYAGGAGQVVTAIDQGTPLFAAVTVDVNLPPLLRAARSNNPDFEDVMRFAWNASQQAVDLGLVVPYIQSLGLWGASNADLAIMGIAYNSAGGTTSTLKPC
jgi:hypothetical protein